MARILFVYLMIRCFTLLSLSNPPMVYALRLVRLRWSYTNGVHNRIDNSESYTSSSDSYVLVSSSGFHMYTVLGCTSDNTQTCVSLSGNVGTFLETPSLIHCTIQSLFLSEIILTILIVVIFASISKSPFNMKGLAMPMMHIICFAQLSSATLTQDKYVIENCVFQGYSHNLIAINNESVISQITTASDLDGWYLDYEGQFIALTYHDVDSNWWYYLTDPDLFEAYSYFFTCIFCRNTPPTNEPTINQTLSTFIPTVAPSFYPTTSPESQTDDPTFDPTINPTSQTNSPTLNPTLIPSLYPTLNPASDATSNPTLHPTFDPKTKTTQDTQNSNNDKGTLSPTLIPSFYPTLNPAFDATSNPTLHSTFDLKMKNTLLQTVTKYWTTQDTQNSTEDGDLYIQIAGAFVAGIIVALICCFLCSKKQTISGVCISCVSVFICWRKRNVQVPVSSKAIGNQVDGRKVVVNVSNAVELVNDFPITPGVRIIDDVVTIGEVNIYVPEQIGEHSVTLHSSDDSDKMYVEENSEGKRQEVEVNATPLAERFTNDIDEPIARENETAADYYDKVYDKIHALEIMDPNQ